MESIYIYHSLFTELFQFKIISCVAKKDMWFCIWKSTALGEKPNNGKNNGRWIWLGGWWSATQILLIDWDRSLRFERTAPWLIVLIKTAMKRKGIVPQFFLSPKSHILDRNWVWNDEDDEEEDYDDNSQFGLPGWTPGSWRKQLPLAGLWSPSPCPRNMDATQICLTKVALIRIATID